MPTNEERREVARKLRECSKEKVVYYPISNLFAATGTADELILFDRLADLIEPEPERTCRKVPGRMRYGERKPKCSECGYSLGDPRWFYCPKCGGRIEE